MSLSVTITPAAEADLAEAIAWCESNHPNLSFDLRLTLDAALDRIAHYPDSYATLALSVRRALLRRFPLAVYYRRKQATIEVIAILHTHRHPRIWRKRAQ